MDAVKLFNEYMTKRDWRVKENSNAPYSFGAMNKYITSAASKEYWTDAVYGPEVCEAHDDGYLHLHDMGGLTLYCCGYSLQTILQKGVRGVPNIPTSKPAKHFDAILNQIANLMTIFQNEIMGAVALSSFDTLLAPFVAYDNCSAKEVKQSVQNFIYSVNSNSRAGAEPAFTNLTFDLQIPDDLQGTPVIIGGDMWVDGNHIHTYSEYQKEADMINRAFWEIMLEGDAEGKPFAYPIPTYSIQEGFDYDNPDYELLWEMTGKYGYPYFSNYVNSDMKPSDVRSMCCRLRLDLTELRRRNGGLFGSGDSTGSIGVVTLNLPRMAYESTDKEDLFEIIRMYMNIAKESLEDKRNWLVQNIIGTGMIPAFDEYVGTTDNHFSTIGLVGLNEMIMNCQWLGYGNETILTPAGKQLALDTLDFMRNELIEFQQLTGHLYNLEATPAESTCYRLAKLDVQKYGDKIKTQGSLTAPYYTNSCHIPVKDNPGFWDTLAHQDDLQCKFTGGTVVHLFSEGAISADAAKRLVKKTCETYKLPYITHSPVIKLCPEHGNFDAHLAKCPICGSTGKTLQRITGYIREVANYNPGKLEEFRDRRQNSTEVIENFDLD